MAVVLALVSVQSGPLKEIGLYLHVPFCHARCGYCDFATFAGMQHRIADYLQALNTEISLQAPAYVSTIFVGGGTPTVLTPSQITHLFQALHAHFDLRHLKEATVEANPESATDAVLSAYVSAGVNRISFGLQTADNTLLKSLDRLHTFEEFVEAYRRAQKIGFKNINVDLIYGLPGQTLKGWSDTLDRVLALEPSHVSAYALKIEDGTKFAAQNTAVDDDLEADMYLLASDRLSKSGYRHYEISNFARTGFESQHNLKYWRNEPTVGLGLSSTSFLDGKRIKNTKVLQTYIDRLADRKLPIDEIIELGKDQREKENIMLGLRLDDGVKEEDVAQLQIPLFSQFVHQQYAAINSGRYRLNPQGWLLSNQLFQNLI